MSDDQDWVRWNASYWNAEAGAATARAERAEAAIERVRGLLLDEFGHSIHDTKRITLRELRAALDGTDNTGGTPPSAQPAYDAVYAYIRSLGDSLPPTPAHRNAAIWRGVDAALKAFQASAQLPEERSDEKVDPGFGTASTTAAELVQAATSGGRMSEDMRVELAPERSDEIVGYERIQMPDGERIVYHAAGVEPECSDEEPRSVFDEAEEDAPEPPRRSGRPVTINIRRSVSGLPVDGETT